VQLTTWLPACSTAAEYADGVCSAHIDGSAPPLADYANKGWGGLVAGYYAQRIGCYLGEALTAQAGGLVGGVNVTAYYSCLDGLARSFQADTVASTNSGGGGNGGGASVCLEPAGDPVALSLALIDKYRAAVPP